MTNSGALRNLIAEAADRTGATLVAAVRGDARGACSKALDQPDITNPLDTKRTIPTGAIRGLPRRAGGRARSRHRADRRGAAAATTASSAASPICASLEAASRARRRAGKTAGGVHAASRRARPTTAARCGREIPHVPILRGIERTLRVMRRAGATPAPRRSDRRRSSRRRRDRDLRASWRARAAALDRSHRAQRGRIEVAAARLRHPAAAGTSRRHAPTKRRSGRARDRLSGRAQGGVGGAAAQERRRAGDASISATPTPCGKRSHASRTAQARCSAPLDGILVAQQVVRRHRDRARRQPRCGDGPGRHVRHGRRLGRAVQGRELCAGGLDRDQALAMVRATRAGPAARRLPRRQARR